MKVLVVDDDEGILLALSLLLQKEGIAIVKAKSPEQACVAAARDVFDLFILDLNYTKDTTSGKEGLSLLSTIRAEWPRKPILVMTGWVSIEGAVESMRRGASDYVPKPWDNQRLVELIRKFDPSNARASTPDDWDALAEQSSAMRPVLAMIEGVSRSDLPVLITGEHGTGKEVVARRIHAKSARSGEFVAVNAGALPDTMLESELFGHVRGAFTDAKATRLGAFAEAAQGTLFLDEVANMPLAQQAKLLRVLQDGEYRPLGASVSERSSARIVSATNAAIADHVRAGSFRPDLLYRLNVIHLHLPPLRERREMIVVLASRFVAQTAARHGMAVPEIEPAALTELVAFSWPGNVRELEHTMQRATLLSSTTGRISPQTLGLSAETYSTPIGVAETSLKDAERAIILNAIERNPGDRLAAAKSLGMTRSSFYRRVQRLGIKLGR